MNELNFDTISLNTRGLGNFTKREKIFKYVKKSMSLEAVSFFSRKHIACNRTKKFGPINLGAERDQ